MDDCYGVRNHITTSQHRYTDRMNQQAKPASIGLLKPLLAVGLVILTALCAGAMLTDLADTPDARNQFLDAGWERELVDGYWWMFLIVAMLAYATRLRLAYLTTQNRRALRWIVPIEVLAIAVLSVVVALALSWNSVVN